jgi:hypothetical protein
VALWALGFVRVSVRARTGGCGSGSSLTTNTAAQYNETLTKEMEYFKSNDSHPILSSKVFLTFGKTAAIDNLTFGKWIRMQNEYLYKIRHIEIDHVCNIDK